MLASSAVELEAAPLVISVLESGWHDPVGGVNVSIDNGTGLDADEIRWGRSNRPSHSGLIMDVADAFGTPEGLALVDDTVVLLTTLSHENLPGDFGTAPDYIDYRLTLRTNGRDGDRPLTISFFVDERSDRCDEQQDPGCSDDLIHFPSYFGPITIFAGNTRWSLSRLFSRDGQNFNAAVIVAPENHIDRIGFYLHVAAETIEPVPEPSIPPLLLLVFLALLTVPRRAWA